MKLVRGITLLSATAVLAIGGPAQALQTPAALARRPAVEVADGAPVRVAGELAWHSVPPQHARAWSRLVAAMGADTWAVWDRDTGVVRRVWGAGVATPGVMASAELAERTARAFLQRHLDLLAPGAAASDFALVADHLGGGMRTLGFAQRSGGLPVDGGQLSFRFKNDRLFMIGSEALPHVPAPAAIAISNAAAASAALAWLQRDTSKAARVTDILPARVLPLIRAGAVEYRTVIPVIVASTAPHGRWIVHVDAAKGTPVARIQTIKFATGTLNYNAPVRGPGGTRKDYPAVLADVTVNGQNATTTTTGQVMWANNNPAQVGASVVGDHVDVNNEQGPDATQNLNLPANGSIAWNGAANELLDAQLTTFVHTNVVQDFMRAIDPANPWFSIQLPAIVNIPEACNAFYDGGQINFFAESQDCNNTGRVADIVYHEFGHGVHDKSIIEGVGSFDGALSEGVSDYLAATITDDPAMGVEFFKGDPGPLRHIDPPGDEAFWPDDIDGDTHITGLIIAGALWDLRKALVADEGPGGVAMADRLYYEAVRRATDIPTMYHEVLAADDDDGDLANGTPHQCLINTVFAAHGLYAIALDVTAPGLAAPQLDGYEVSAALSGGGGQCQDDGIESATLVWRLREDPNTGGSLPMAVAPDKISATIPKQPAGSVVQYQLKVDFVGDTNIEYPENRADPFYEFFVGAVEDIYCTDFETDPAGDGWTHALDNGPNMEGADDWMWAVPMSPVSSGDPQAAYDGAMAYGNDLGGGMYNGLYQAEITNHTQTPAIDTTGYGEVRLQYRRWLNVEDGFYDRATIYANNQTAWQNLKTQNMDDASVHHTDREWRFHDVDLTPFVANNSVTLKFELSSDQGLFMGGWTLDAFCVVGVVDAPPAACGDGFLNAPEQCDDGAANSDTTPDACRTDCTLAACGDGVVDAGESCDDNNQNGGDECPADCGNPEATTGAATDDGSGGGSGEDDSGATPTDSGATPTGGAADETGDDPSSGSSSDTAGTDTDDGCGCAQAEPNAGLGLLALGLLGLRRRRR